MIFVGCFASISCNSTDVNIPFDHRFHMEPILPYNTWGTFRGMYYFGLRTTQPDSPSIGLIWFKNSASDVSHLQLRHTCHPDDGIIYGWKAHNFQDFGFQTITDQNYKLNTSFVKHTNANNWSALVSVDKITANNINDETMSVVMYISLMRDKDYITISGFNTSFINIKGYNQYIGNFTLNIKAESNALIYGGQLVSNATIIDISKAIKSNLSKMTINGTDIYGLKQGITPTHTHLIAYQVVSKGSFKVRTDFSTGKSYLNDIQNNEDFESELKKKIYNFDEEFDKKFRLKSKGFNESQIAFGKSILSEMIGSIGYFNGNLSVNSPGMTQPKTYGPLQILSAVPSRPIFPRPFLWDEGFHNLVIQRWNSSLTTTIMKSWFNLMNVDGWIPREITIGAESIDNFHGLNTQTDVNANPPSFLLTIDTLMKNNEIDKSYLKEIYPRLSSWFNWYNTSQSGTKMATYRWRGRSQDSIHELNPSTLTSGLDDYPRATHPTDDEYHLDLRCWIWLAADVMTRIADAIGDTVMKSKYKATADLLADNGLLETLHWSEADKAYCDYGYHSTNVSLVKDSTGQYVRKVWTPPKYQLTCDQLGYVNLFPLMFGLIEPNNTRLGHVLDIIGNSSQMGSPYGLSSLSKTSFYYNKWNSQWGSPYWRGPIWININYLVLRSLHYYGSLKGPNQLKAQNLYKELRNNIITNMFNQYEKTGFIWEQYNDISGSGQCSHPFVGWSGVVLLIMTESY
ncbi:mannosyl-oligosaccharide glucosidase-like [Oppia nitens]|uniref:mannosyl-oligosaccharide glucosidase-like n=1 Tax=Oppia nitens TaxID=1686743 RepID=UPI0023DC0996|nr:mannosyl-oligosaccharide glucosidase-like [Oppia nitens]